MSGHEVKHCCACCRSCCCCCCCCCSCCSCSCCSCSCSCWLLLLAAAAAAPPAARPPALHSPAAPSLAVPISLQPGLTESVLARAQFQHVVRDLHDQAVLSRDLSTATRSHHGRAKTIRPGMAIGEEILASSETEAAVLEEPAADLSSMSRRGSSSSDSSVSSDSDEAAAAVVKKTRRGSSDSSSSEANSHSSRESYGSIGMSAEEMATAAAKVLAPACLPIVITSKSIELSIGDITLPEAADSTALRHAGSSRRKIQPQLPPLPLSLATMWAVWWSAGTSQAARGHVGS